MKPSAIAPLTSVLFCRPLTPLYPVFGVRGQTGGFDECTALPPQTPFALGMLLIPAANVRAEQPPQAVWEHKLQVV